MRFGLCKHAAVCRECWLTTLHSWKKSSAPTCPMCRMPVPSFSVFDAARGACDEESQCGGGSQRDLPLRFRSIHEASQDEERAVPQPYSLARPVEALPEEGGSPPGGLAAWFMRPFESQNAASQQEEAQPLSVMRPFETQPGTIVYPLDTSQHGDSTTMRPFEAPMVMMRPLASEATLEDSHLPQISVTTPPRPGEPGVSLTASIVFPSVDAPDAYTTSMTPVVRASN